MIKITYEIKNRDGIWTTSQTIAKDFEETDRIVTLLTNDEYKNNYRIISITEIRGR